MKIKQDCDNGNVGAVNQYNSISQPFVSNKNCLSLNKTQDNTRRFNENLNINNTPARESEQYDNTTLRVNDNITEGDVNVTFAVCNRLYRLNTENNVICSSAYNNKGENKEGGTNAAVTTRAENIFYTYNGVPNEEQTNADSVDTDEMSEKNVQVVPRGIVNPNYPGFQHLAHTLQDYSSTIENFYHSENDMTDDDIELELTDSTEYNLEHTPSINESQDNNNITDNLKTTTTLILKNDLVKSDSINIAEIPDLIKTVSKNNNNNNIEELSYGLNFSETDIENNFHKKDIIGDFNKEVEDEIKHVLNYNINIQDDLDELRKDIKDTFAKPIENTINNISDVVNDVIKKLVENKENIFEISDSKELSLNLDQNEQVRNKCQENEANTRIGMPLSRPTFLLLDTNPKTTIADAFLSDGTDEINVNYENEINVENISYNVESTIKQLSTELRKIIPKLDEMRERDKMWAMNKIPSTTVITDDNSNEIGGLTKYRNHNVASAGPSTKPLETLGPTSTCLASKKTTPTETIISKSYPLDGHCSKIAHKPLKSSASVRSSIRVKESSNLDSFDVYNIETALPKIDLDAIESHLKAAKEAERRKRNDREEIRKRLAMGIDNENEYYSIGHVDRPTKKPSLHSRLQNGKSLQICYMNESASDNESHSDNEKSNSNKSLSQSSIFSKSSYNHPYQTRPLSVNITKNDKVAAGLNAKLRPPTFSLRSTKSKSSHSLNQIELRESDFYALQATLQTEARIALAQAKEMARTQMERERRSRAVSPVTEMLQASMEKAHAPIARDRRRLSRQLLTDMNIAQLQVIVNELHCQIEALNDSLVKLLMARDELHMSQDSMLVDIEDLTRYLGVKQEQSKKKAPKSGVRRLASYMHK